jgi:hypothetical protein
LKFNLSLTKKKSALLFKAPIIFLHIDEVEIFELIFKSGEGFYRILHHHLAVDFIHNHHSGIVDSIFLGMSLLPKKIVVDSILMVFVVVINVLSKLIQKEDELLLLDGFFNEEVGSS